MVYRSLSDTKELARTQELAVSGGAWDNQYANHRQIYDLEPLSEDGDGSFSPGLADANAKFDAAEAANVNARSATHGSTHPNGHPKAVERIGTKGGACRVPKLHEISLLKSEISATLFKLSDH